MVKRMHYFFKRFLDHHGFLLSGLIPSLLLISFFFYQGVYPFGNKTALTVDLSQQYIDFFQFYRNTFLQGTWSNFWYSFQKGYAGEMIGTWSYYLMSPFNLILLLFPQDFLPCGIICLILAKISGAGMAFYYFLKKVYQDSSFMILPFSLAYAFMGYTSANQLNIMWLDALILLPVIVEHLFDLVLQKKWKAYCLSLTALLFIQYYMGYMVCLFLPLFFLYLLIVYLPSNHRKAWLFQRIKSFVFSSLLSGGLASFFLIPTFYALQESKGIHSPLTLTFESLYPLWHLLSKFIIGAFNHDQLPSGLPNLFVGSLVLICFFLYFVQSKFALKERLSAFFISLFFIFSLNNDALNVIWHGMQHPIWYPYRFSFLISFWMIFLAYKTFRQLKSIHLLQAFLLLGSALIGAYLLYTHLQNFPYLQLSSLICSVFIFAGCLCLLLAREVSCYLSFFNKGILLLTLVELGLNHFATLNSLSYVSYSDFVSAIHTMQPPINTLQNSDPSFYRMAKTFQRSKNDAFQFNYRGLEQFNSTLEQGSIQLYSKLGLPSGSGFINYHSGTLLTDALFGVKYFIQPTPTDQNVHPGSRHTLSKRFDIASYSRIKNSQDFQIVQNPYALSLGYLVPSTFTNFNQQIGHPIDYQDALLRALLGDNSQHDKEAFFHYFKLENYFDVQTSNLKAKNPDLVNTHYQKENSTHLAYIDIILDIPNNHAYYLTLPNDLDSQQVSFYLDGQKLPYDSSYHNTQIINVANQEAGVQKKFTIKVKTDTLDLKQINFYSLDPQWIQILSQQLGENQLHMTHFSNISLEGQLTVPSNKNTLLLTIPYSKGWKATIDQENYPLSPCLSNGGTLLKNLPVGVHKVSLTYFPPGLSLGSVLSCLSLLVFFKEKTLIHLLKKLGPTLLK